MAALGRPLAQQPRGRIGLLLDDDDLHLHEFSHSCLCKKSCKGEVFG
jgi:hypothetical protein